jgi:O-antigen ligase
MIVNIALTGSRNAMLGFGIGCVLLAIFYSYKFIAFIGGVGAIALIIPQVRGRILQIANGTQDASRIKLWRIALDIIKDHPIRGVGNGNYPVYYKFYEYRYHYIEYYPEGYPNSNVHPHNILLKVQSEMGILGLIIFLGLLISTFLNINKFSKFVKDVHLKIYYKGFLVAFVVFILMNMIDNFFSAPKVIAYFWIFIAISQSIAFKSDLAEDAM